MVLALLCFAVERGCMHHKLCFLSIPPKGGLPYFHFFVKCRGMDPRKQDFGQDTIQRNLRTCRQPISDNRLQVLTTANNSIPDWRPGLTSESGRGSAMLASERTCTFYDSNSQALFFHGKTYIFLRKSAPRMPMQRKRKLFDMKEFLIECLET